MAAAVTATTLTRSIFSLLLGALALWRFGSAAALLIGVGLGYGLGAIPVFLQLRGSIWRSGFVWPTRDVIGRILRYGWPLILAFGASAAAMNVDRIMLAHISDTATVAPYGAVLDFMKQTFAVVGEATAIGYMSYARTLYSDGNHPAAQVMLKRASVAQCYIVVFGVAFYLLLGQPLFEILLAPGYVGEALGLLPVLVVANAILLLRSYLFAQVIYFSASSKLESISSITMLIAGIIASWLLIPRFGATGAAFAFLLAQAAALLVYVVLTPRALRLPIDFERAAALVGAGLAIVAVGKVAAITADPAIADLADFVLLAAGSLYFLIRWNLFDAAAIGRRLRARLLRPGVP
jgi:O-antigen/teichoic acid export membrane protein